MEVPLRGVCETLPVTWCFLSAGLCLMSLGVKFCSVRCHLEPKTHLFQLKDHDQNAMTIMCGNVKVKLVSYMLKN